jgi:hypothetical protein
VILFSSWTVRHGPAEQSAHSPGRSQESTSPLKALRPANRFHPPLRTIRITQNAFIFLLALAPYVEAGMLWRTLIHKLMGEVLGIAAFALSGLTATAAWFSASFTTIRIAAYRGRTATGYATCSTQER